MYRIVKGHDIKKVEKEVEKLSDKGMFLASPMMMAYDGKNIIFAQPMSKPTREQQDRIDEEKTQNAQYIANEAILAYLDQHGVGTQLEDFQKAVSR